MRTFLLTKDVETNPKKQEFRNQQFGPEFYADGMNNADQLFNCGAARVTVCYVVEALFVKFSFMLGFPIKTTSAVLLIWRKVT